MDFNQLNHELNLLRVQPKDVLRASLYIDYLEQAQQFFHNTMAGLPPNGLGTNYQYVQNAVRSSNLLKELAKVLDFFVAPAVNADLQRAYKPITDGGLGHGGNHGWTYRQYFDNVILNANRETYQGNVTAFRARCPVTHHALERLATHFRNNILEACQRVIADKDALTRFYNDLYNKSLAINSLDAIKSTGSDFHKGGKQVLILTFDITYTSRLQTKRETLKVVYKPSDLEADCLIIGDSAAINRAIPGGRFMTNSLVEIYNNRLKRYKEKHSNFGGQPLATYRILPRNYISAHMRGYPLPIREAYGYIEYLNYEFSGSDDDKLFSGFYPGAESDYLVFKSQDEKDIVRKFYRKEGAFAALCCTFSLLDMHIENLRVKQYTPYPIDLEVSLTKPVAGITETLLFNATFGGINACYIEGQDYRWIVQDINTPGRAPFKRHYATQYYQNRLWRSRSNGQKQLIRVNGTDFLRGYSDGMAVLKACQENSDFTAWFARLNDVVVRYIPYSTTFFRDIRKNVFEYNVESNPGEQLDAALQKELRACLTLEYNQYQRHQEPKFLALTDVQSGEDYRNLDIPVFYHRIGTQAIVNSRGEKVLISANIAIDGLNGPINAPVNVGRDTFFPNPPTEVNVDQGQVQILGGDGFSARVLAIQNTIQTALSGPAAADLIRPILK